PTDRIRTGHSYPLLRPPSSSQERKRRRSRSAHRGRLSRCRRWHRLLAMYVLPTGKLARFAPKRAVVRRVRSDCRLSPTLQVWLPVPYRTPGADPRLPAYEPETEKFTSRVSVLLAILSVILFWSR